MNITEQAKLIINSLEKAKKKEELFNEKKEKYFINRMHLIITEKDPSFKTLTKNNFNPFKIKKRLRKIKRKMWDLHTYYEEEYHKAVDIRKSLEQDLERLKLANLIVKLLQENTNE